MVKKTKNVTYTHNVNDLLTPYVGSETAYFFTWIGCLNWYCGCFD